jgi:hypothetical protein
MFEGLKCADRNEFGLGDAISRRLVGAELNAVSAGAVLGLEVLPW